VLFIYILFMWLVQAQGPHDTLVKKNTRVQNCLFIEDASQGKC